jgi:hypothetical protein
MDTTMSTEKRDGITHFEFQAKVFTVPGARFALVGPRQEPRFFVNYGEIDGSMDIQALRVAFSIPAGGDDDKMIVTAVKGLRYVPDIRPGDKIPSEIIDGTASWSIAPRHKEIAYRRLQVQLLSWVSGKEIVLTDNDELGNFLDQIENKTKLKEAFEAAAEALGRPRADFEAVLQQIESLARELCFIEALRDRFLKVAGVLQKLQHLRSHYSGDTKGREDLQRVSQLAAKAVSLYTKKFEEVDAQTSEIIGALKSLERQVEFIRRTRDDLHFILRDWDPILPKWDTTALKRSRPIDLLISDTYRLLAGKFTSARSMLKAA